MIEFSELRGSNKIFGSFCKINEPNILFGPLISENSIVTPPLVVSIVYTYMCSPLSLNSKKSLSLQNAKWVIMHFT